MLDLPIINNNFHIDFGLIHLLMVSLTPARFCKTELKVKEIKLEFLSYLISSLSI